MRSLAVAGLMLIIAGILLVVASFLVGAGEEGVGGAAGCIIIGPIPICFTGKGAATAVILVGVLLMAIVFGIAVYIILKAMKYYGAHSLTY